MTSAPLRPNRAEQEVAAGGPRWFGTLQYLRAVAAFSVVLYHASFYTNLYTGDGRFLAAFGGGLGSFGVLVFFALSGHLMAVQAARMAGRPTSFMLHRLARIYPIFWLVCLVRIGIGLSLGTGLFDPLTLMLSPVGQRDYPLGVEWTLVYEVAFYIFVGVVIAARLERWVGVIGVAWVATIVLRGWWSGFSSPMLTDSLLDVPLSSVCAAFAAGLTIPGLLVRGWVGPAFLPAGALLIAAAGLPQAANGGTVITGLGCAALVAWVASLETGTGSGVQRSRMLGRLGDWSYAVYLLHVPVLTTVGTVAAGAGGSVLWIGMVGLVLAVTPLVGAADSAIHAGLRRASDRWGRGLRIGILVMFAAGFAGCMAASLWQRQREAEGFGPLALDDGPAAEALERMGWRRDGGLTGLLDPPVRSMGLTYLSGWVLDPSDALNRAAVLVVVSGGSTVAVARSYRFDVIRAFGLGRATGPTGFRKGIADSACPAGAVAHTVAISRRTRTYALLNSVPCPH